MQLCASRISFIFSKAAICRNTYAPYCALQICAESDAANAKPRELIVGLLERVTYGDILSSRYRDVCRPVIAGFGVTLLEVSSIDMASIFGFTLSLDLPVGIKVANTATTFVICPGNLDQNNPQT